MKKHIKKIKLTITSETLRAIEAQELHQVNGGISVNCTRAGVSLCLFGCTEPPLAPPAH